jgi:hypothetical protein
MKPEHKIFLDMLRESGETNMFGATPYLVCEFDLTKNEARAILTEWMRTFTRKEVVV